MIKSNFFAWVLSCVMLSAIGCETQVDPARQAVRYVVTTHKIILDRESDPEKIISEMKQIDLSECPADFSKAYRDHIAVWEKLTAADEVQTERSVKQLTEKILKGKEESPEDINKNFEESVKLRAKEQKILSELGSSGRSVKTVATKYGADFPDVIYSRISFGF